METLDSLGIEPASLDQRVAAAHRPMLVEFWAPWCGTCRLMAPSLARLKTEMEGAVDVVTVNVEAGQDIAQAQGVLSLPTIIAYSGGREVSRIHGLKSYANLLAAARELATN